MENLIQSGASGFSSRNTKGQLAEFNDRPELEKNRRNFQKQIETFKINLEETNQRHACFPQVNIVLNFLKIKILRDLIPIFAILHFPDVVFKVNAYRILRLVQCPPPTTS